MEDEEEKREFITNHFMNLFRSNGGGDANCLQQVLNVVQPYVTPAMNELLSMEFTTEEVKKALDAIRDMEALGPDGMPALFFKEYWDVVGSKLTEEVLQVLNGHPMHAGWNETVISLIPKTEKQSWCLICVQ